MIQNIAPQYVYQLQFFFATDNILPHSTLIHFFFLNFILFTGPNCEENLDECLSNPCQNGATCHDKDNGYVCTCQAGYTGLHCETDIAVCETGKLNLDVYLERKYFILDFVC